ncbi:hypothetical protein N7474_000301 [Penicillium riverlandense]|uniref:uncharacterized protein n=1 Tax=Penicillium riverlandense TaxID=1903569 RepID=UPI0025469193|nr:uncharacterized protein N7474_000301 [Penicillium riverlandense]KAJ5831990.1 hypothetical protein N7474_000301 [Penicillium riverlandense]
MARDNDKGKDKDASSAPRHTDADDETNPFVAFRRFADEQVSSMLQSVTGLPSTISSPHSDRWEIFNDDYGYKNMTARQRSSENSSEEPASERGANASSSREQDDSSHRNPSPSRSSRSHLPENDDRWPSQSWKKWRNGSADFFGLDSFFDRFWLEDRFFPFSSHFFHPHRTFFIPDMFEDTDSPTWPITYIMFSPYSPLYLERQAQYHKHREQGVFTSLVSTLRLDSNRDPAEPQWREAFEDLLRLENGKQMLDRDISAVSKTESGSDWVQGLVKRGSLGDRWKYVCGTENQPWSGITFTGPSREKKELEDSNENGQRGTKSEVPETELDLYNRFLQDIEARERDFFQGGESPLLRFLLEERRRQQEELDQYRRSVPRVEDEQGNDDTESWLDLVSGGSRKSVPETVKESDSPADATSTDSSALQPHVVSTMVRTERVRLADGSIQTKTVKTKRFADGREENDTSIEVTRAPRSQPEESQLEQSQSEESQSESTESGKSKTGWFWKDE